MGKFDERHWGLSVSVITATSRHPDAALACDAIRMAVAVRGGVEAVWGVIFHTDKGSTYTAEDFTRLCAHSGIRQSMGRVGSCLLTG